MQESRVGSKGELFPPKEMREKLGLKACSRVIFKVESGRLIVESVPTIKQAIEAGTQVEITLEEFHKQRRDLSMQAEA
jgi:AbrB family looped-hinge helix DNA binding protein